eukprot:TRINITY_DN106447_c0_g1_i1.p1 TRINITY_DN106447_c0_g1~~TRINITY_DN106447_c0_g1_i1.p1  ORF type:complete len:143 (+),score=22.95 TRINITY_DN106447_c0_g1_i1:40-468(+)
MPKTPLVAGSASFAVLVSALWWWRRRHQTSNQQKKMPLPPDGAVGVIFISGRNGADATGYTTAAAAMVTAAQAHDGFLRIDSSARDENGLGITISWWRDEAAALSWKNDAAHARIRQQGRAMWYDWYQLTVVTANRSYEWQR